LTFTIWRIVHHRHAKTAFSGEGARLYGGRWNSPGTPMIYCAGSQSLAILEMLAHLDSTELLKKYVLFPVEIEAAFVAHVDRSILPKNWNADPVPSGVQAIGDSWATARSSVALSVPSALVPDESNYLLNPLHPDFIYLKIGKPDAFQFDRRFARHRS